MITKGLERSLMKRSSDSTSEGIITSKTAAACTTIANVIVKPCAANLFIRANLKRPTNKAIMTMISRKRAISDVSGAFPRMPAISASIV
jgi:hypothetical protein